MISNFIPYIILVTLISVLAQELMKGHNQETESNYQTVLQESEFKDIEKCLDDIDQLAPLVEQSRRDDNFPKEHMEELYKKIIESLDKLLNYIQSSENTYKFLESNSLHKVVNITRVNHNLINGQFLLILKTLFSIDPIATMQKLPPNVIDKVLDIFENDDNIDIKSQALDVMCVWLPKNPKIQARVMKVKGLEAFYDQISKLNASLIYTLLELFNNIFEEHLIQRNESHRDENKGEITKSYEHIGLIERMSTPTACNGLLNIFKMISEREDLGFTPSVFGLIKNIKPFCLKFYKGKVDILKVFESISKQIKVSNNDSNFVEIKDMLVDFMKKVRDGVHEEF